jgi:uncharacterized protein
MVAFGGEHMRPSVLVEKHREAIKQVVAANRASNPRVFGSVARGDDDEESDVDILIDPDENMSLWDMARITRKLQDMLGVEVDIVSSRVLKGRFGRSVLSAVKPL